MGLGLGPSRGYVDHLLEAGSLLRRSLSYFVDVPDTLGRLYPLSWLALALVVSAALLMLLRWRQRRLPDTWPAALFHLVVTLAAMLMTTAVALPLWDALLPLLGHLQYPWRFLLVEAVGLVGLAAAMPALLPKVRPAILITATAGLAMLVALPGLRVEPLALSLADQWLPEQMWRGDTEAGQIGATWTGEFLPLTVSEQRWALGRTLEGAQDSAPLLPAPQVTITDLGYDRLAAQVSSGAPWSLRLHQFHLPGWQATVDDMPAATYPSGELGLVTLDLPAGEHAVQLVFGDTPDQQAGALISLVGLAVWLALVWWRGRRRSLHIASVAVALLALAVAANSLGAGRQTVTPTPVNATVGDVAVLLATEARALPELDVAEVTLVWLALRETRQDFKAFVHLLGADGAVIAQHDGDPVGGFTPATRWRAGEIVVDRHYLPLPADLAAGSYGLRAGMYQLDPLRNLTVDPPSPDDRVDLGVDGDRSMTDQWDRVDARMVQASRIQSVEPAATVPKELV